MTLVVSVSRQQHNSSFWYWAVFSATLYCLIVRTANVRALAIRQTLYYVHQLQEVDTIIISV